MAFIGSKFDECDQAALGYTEYGLDEDGFSISHTDSDNGIEEAKGTYTLKVSPKLLAAVLGSVPGWYKNIHITGSHDVLWTSPETVSGINIYELAHKCKVWVFNNQFRLDTESYTEKYVAILSYTETLPEYDKFGQRNLHTYSKKFDNYVSEIDAIFAATEWVIDYKNKKENTDD